MSLTKGCLTKVKESDLLTARRRSPTLRESGKENSERNLVGDDTMRIPKRIVGCFFTSNTLLYFSLASGSHSFRLNVSLIIELWKRTWKQKHSFTI